MPDALPAPLALPEVDLRGYEFMPLFGDRLLGSETWIAASPEAKIAALRLWWRSYAKEVPASSLPNNDTLLAEYAGYGVALKAWQKIKPQVMRGFVLCADDRWYHPFVAELALDAWKGRKAHQLRTLKARIANTEKRLSAAVTDDEKAHINGLLRDLRQTLSQALNEPVTDKKAGLLHTTKGQGEERTGRGQDKEKPEKPNGGAFTPPEWVPADAWKGYVEMRRRIGKPLTPYACQLGVRKLERLRAQGYAPETVLEAAIFNSWQGLFPPKDMPVPQQSKRVAL